MFNPGDHVQYRTAGSWAHAVVIRVIYPFARQDEKGVEFCALPDVMAVIRFADGTEEMVSCDELRHV